MKPPFELELREEMAEEARERARILTVQRQYLPAGDEREHLDEKIRAELEAVDFWNLV